MNNVYVSKPFVVSDGEEVAISPIELSKKNRKNNPVTTGVLLKNNVPAEGYIIKIFKVSKSKKATFVGFTFTDSFGQFTIPLSSGKGEYLIKVYSLKEEVENIELIIKKENIE